MSILQRYNGLDTVATFQLWKALEQQFQTKQWAKATYELSKELEPAALYAMLRGILIDTSTFEPMREQFLDEIECLQDRLDFITQHLGLGVINLGSPVQVKWLFDCLSAPIKSSDRDHIEKLALANIDLAPVCNLILMWRDRVKMLQTLDPTAMDPDGRMRTFYRVGGTDTGMELLRQCPLDGLQHAEHQAGRQGGEDRLRLLKAHLHR